MKKKNNLPMKKFYVCVEFGFFVLVLVTCEAMRHFIAECLTLSCKNIVSGVKMWLLEGSKKYKQSFCSNQVEYECLFPVYR